MKIIYYQMVMMKMKSLRILSIKETQHTEVNEYLMKERILVSINSQKSQILIV
jgi:hypothetical protein